MITMMMTKDDDKGDDKNLKDQSKNNSSESRTIQGSRSQESRSRFNTQDSRIKRRHTQDKYEIFFSKIE